MPCRFPIFQPDAAHVTIIESLSGNSVIMNDTIYAMLTYTPLDHIFNTDVNGLQEEESTCICCFKLCGDNHAHHDMKDYACCRGGKEIDVLRP